MVAFVFPAKSIQLLCDDATVLVGDKLTGILSLQQRPERSHRVVLSLDATVQGTRAKSIFHKSLLVRPDDFEALCTSDSKGKASNEAITFQAKFSIRVPANYPADRMHVSHTLRAAVKTFGRGRDLSDVVALAISSHDVANLAHTQPTHQRSQSVPLSLTPPPKSIRRRTPSTQTLLMAPLHEMPELHYATHSSSSRSSSLSSALEPSTRPAVPLNAPGSPGSLCDSDWSFSTASGASTPGSPMDDLRARSSFSAALQLHLTPTKQRRHTRTFSLQSLASLTDGRSSVLGRFARKLQFRADEEEEDLAFACCGQEEALGKLALQEQEVQRCLSPLLPARPARPAMQMPQRPARPEERRLQGPFDYEFGF